MGKVKTVTMGDEKAEELARAKAQVKRDAKKQLKKVEASEDEPKSRQGGTEAKSSTSKASDDASKAEQILKMMEQEDKEVKAKPAKVEKEEVEPKSEKKTSKAEKKSEEKTIVKSKHGKKYMSMVAKVEKNKLYPIASAIKLAKETSYSSFDGSIEAHFNVSDKGLRGTVSLPHGTGKQVRVAIADDAILEEVAAGKINFDVLVAHPSMMPKLAKVAKILGPKGLMPNPKTGTIGDKPEEIAKKLSSGQFNWKTEPNFPIVHVILGKVSFDDKKIEENYLTLAKSIGKDKLKSAFIKASMGPSVKVQI